jgi:hypothetical protein
MTKLYIIIWPIGQSESQEQPQSWCGSRCEYDSVSAVIQNKSPFTQILWCASMVPTCD